MSLQTQAAELKAQGVEEAARDPKSNVTSDDAQRKMQEESKKAGVPAFKFDPNASPAEKAAAAKAVGPPAVWLLPLGRKADDCCYRLYQPASTRRRVMALE